MTLRYCEISGGGDGSLKTKCIPRCAYFQEKIIIFFYQLVHVRYILNISWETYSHLFVILLTYTYIYTQGRENPVHRIKMFSFQCEFWNFAFRVSFRFDECILWFHIFAHLKCGQTSYGIRSVRYSIYNLNHSIDKVCIVAYLLETHLGA